ncbi:MAG: DNA translocase FtsK 4TM domain-containing protein, partial [Fibrobacteres bacterium]|nr:DNA translocase FtsK 4TM domain-containing protein [Fibrobacterota bacterium]
FKRIHSNVRKPKSLVSRNAGKKGKSNKKKGSAKETDRRGLWGFSILGFAILCGISLISNLISPSDNFLGTLFGNKLSFVLTAFAGLLPSLAIPIIFGYIGIRLIYKKQLADSFRHPFFIGLTLLELTIFLSITNLGEGKSWEQFISTGGLVGNFIVQNIMIKAFGDHKIGAYLVTFVVMSATIIWGFRLDVQELFTRISEGWQFFVGNAPIPAKAKLALSGVPSSVDDNDGPNGAQPKGRGKQAKSKAAVSIVDHPDKDDKEDDIDPAANQIVNGKSIDDLTDEELEELSMNQVLNARLEKRQRAFLREYNGPVIREMVQDEPSGEVPVPAPKRRGKKSAQQPVTSDEQNDALKAEALEESAAAEQTATVSDEAILDADEPAPDLKPLTPEEAAALEVVEEVVEEVIEYDEYVMPPMDLIKDREAQKRGITDEEIKVNADKLIEKLKDFKINGVISEVNPGPVITRYELQLAPGTKLSKVEGLSRDLAVAMAVSKIRICNVPNKSAIGIELPNPKRQVVYIKDVAKSPDFASAPDEIKLALGKDSSGQSVCVNLTKMPHLLIAGTTGSGKSVCTNTFLASILLSKTPEEVKLILIDPKVVEMTLYNGIPHLLSDVITAPKEAVAALKWAAAEMNRRYQLLAKATCRNIAQFNDKAVAGTLENAPIESKDKQRMSYIVIVVDELADLMLAVGKELEEEIVKIAQKARAVGIHLILATQRPEAKVVTGLIKANMPSRVAFMVNSGMDSRIVIDEKGAEELLGMGDMLYKSVEMRDMKRVHGCYIETAESEALVEFASKQNVKRERIKSFVKEEKKANAELPPGSNEEVDELLEAARVIVSRRQASTTLIQRRMSVGYAKAGRLMDQLEEAGIVGPNIGSKARELLVEDVEAAEAYVSAYLSGETQFK